MTKKKRNKNSKVLVDSNPDGDELYISTKDGNIKFIYKGDGKIYKVVDGKEIPLELDTGDASE